MKKITSLLAGLFLMSGMTAWADPINIKVSVDDPEHVTVTSAGATISFDESTNVYDINVEQYSTVRIAGVEPWAIKQLTNETQNYSMASNVKSYDIYASVDGNEFSVTTYNPDETRTATATITVDNAAKVRAMRGGTYEYLTFADGVNTYKFDPATESTLMLGSADYSKPLYEVKLNGEVKTSNYGQYELQLIDGCSVDITAEVPDIDVTITFVYGENAAGAISSVTIDGITVEDFTAETTSLAMKAGQTLVINGSNDFKIDEFSVNGTVTYFYGSYQQTIMEDTEFAVQAHPYGKIKATVIVEDPSTIRLGKGYNIDYGAEPITLNPGETEIELSENNSMICWGAASGCFIESVEIDGILQGTYTTNASLREGSVVKFTSGKIVMDQTMIFWIDNKDAADTYFSLQSNDRQQIEIQNGYNEIPFYSGMLPIGLSWHSNQPVVGQVFVNGIMTSPMYEGSNSYSFDARDKDVVKVFFAAEPVECAVAFDIAEGITLSAKADRITEVSDLTAPLTVFAGTEIAMLVEADKEFTLTAGETELTPDEDGVYTLTVTEPLTIAATIKPQDGISEINSATNGHEAIYDLHGRRVAKVTKGGIYIVNGVKTIVK